MYEFLNIVCISIGATILTCLYVGGIETIIQVLDERKERKQKIKKLNLEIRAWTKIAQEKDNNIEAIGKGYAVAQLLNKAYERKCIKENGGRMQ